MAGRIENELHVAGAAGPGPWGGGPAEAAEPEDGRLVAAEAKRGGP